MALPLSQMREDNRPHAHENVENLARKHLSREFITLRAVLQSHPRYYHGRLWRRDLSHYQFAALIRAMAGHRPGIKYEG